MSKSGLLCFCLLAITPSVLAKPERQQRKCGALKYKVAETYTQTSDMAAMAISINPKDVTMRNLLTLACQLREDYPTEREVSANIFNDERAAKKPTVPTKAGIEGVKDENPDAYLATYYLDRQKGIENITLVIDPNNPCGHDIQIDLQKNTVSIVSCK
jgi:hypothetical protein